MQTVCSIPGCPELATYRDRCAAHRWRPDTPTWQRARRRAKRRDRGRCADCGAPATVLHHLDPHRNGGTDTIDNLVSLCKACHERREVGGHR